MPCRPKNNGLDLGAESGKLGGMSAPGPAVAEMQGLYGPFSFPEKLLQKIWLRGEFERAGATTTDRRRVSVIHPGKWNLLGGPDFRGARLRLGDGPEVVGDIELHLRATDWEAHAHARDRHYDGVVLHVVLFPPEAGHVTRAADGAAIPVLALLPLLHHDLEQYAAEEAVERLAGRPAARIFDGLAGLGDGELAGLLGSHAAARWRQKVHFAWLRVTRLGWEAACHHAALEILGFRFNRAAMLHVAGRWPLVEWGRGRVEPDDVFLADALGWSLQGVRPANHPRRRLRQYRAWTRARPDWPLQLARVADRLAPSPEPAPRPSGGTRVARRTQKFPALRKQLADEICADAVGGPRFDNLVCDGFFPLLASRAALSGGAEGPLFERWYHWFTGDEPPFAVRGLRELGVFGDPGRPACHGAVQGLLGWLLQREAQR